MSAQPGGEPTRHTDDDVLARLAAIDHRLHQITTRLAAVDQLLNQLDDIRASLETLIRSLQLAQPARPAEITHPRTTR
ncbi:MAG: hypothetical protein JO287_07660 [Pseudonocardiales bacterium]|nr:hypothetical protein [Pseudonocardiales bacterium]